MPDLIYRERIFARWLGALTGGLSLLFLSLFAYQALIGPLGEPAPPNLIFLGMFLIFLFLTLNFSALVVSMTTDFLRVRFGLVRRKYRWAEIEGAYKEGATAVVYGGYGIRFGWTKGRSRVAYILSLVPRVFVPIRDGRFDELVFSTRDPGRVIELVHHQIGG
ncbi:MAG: hypothetical protein ACLFUV_04135 [Methanomassiliicoccales archaeon]